MQLNFKFSPEIDFQRIQSTLKKLDWYTANGYKPRLPRKNSEPILDEVQLLKIVKNEYNPKEYEEIQKKLKSEFVKIESDLLNLFKEISKKIPFEFDISLTKYGTGGSYNLSNQIILNIKGKNPLRTLVHEMIHLLLEEKVQKEKLSHLEKEALVESHMEKLSIIF